MDADYPYVSTPCNCQALRQAARRVTQLYDTALAPIGLRTTQYAILSALRGPAPWSIQELAVRMGVDRTTLGRTIRPLVRDGLMTVVPDPSDRRSRALAITPSGQALLDSAVPHWRAVQAQFETGFGARDAMALRAMLQTVVTTAFPNPVAS